MLFCGYLNPVLLSAINESVVTREKYKRGSVPAEEKESPWIIGAEYGMVSVSSGGKTLVVPQLISSQPPTVYEATSGGDSQHIFGLKFWQRDGGWFVGVACQVSSGSGYTLNHIPNHAEATNLKEGKFGIRQNFIRLEGGYNFQLTDWSLGNQWWSNIYLKTGANLYAGTTELVGNGESTTVGDETVSNRGLDVKQPNWGIGGVVGLGMEIGREWFVVDLLLGEQVAYIFSEYPGGKLRTDDGDINVSGQNWDGMQSGLFLALSVGLY